MSQRKWVEAITKQQEVMKQRSTVFDTVSISEGFFIGANRVNCAAPFCKYLFLSDGRKSLIDGWGLAIQDGGRKVVYGVNSNDEADWMQAAATMFDRRSRELRPRNAARW